MRGRHFVFESCLKKEKEILMNLGISSLYVQWDEDLEKTKTNELTKAKLRNMICLIAV